MVVPEPDAARWVAVLPVKELTAAKTRLARDDRAEVALALATDTVAAIAASPLVRSVVVVSDDARARQALTTHAEVVPDAPGAGLNPALEHGAAVARERAPGSPVVALTADLPALRPEELTTALAAAARLGPAARALVADARGTGTVLLAAGPDAPLAAVFGGASRRAHGEGGAVDLTDVLGDAVPGLRRDVDTLDDLADAAVLGLGPATAALVHIPARAPHEWQATVRSWSAEAGGSAVTDDGREVDLPAGLRLVGLRGLRPGQRVRLRPSTAADGHPRAEAAGLVTERF